MRGIDLMVVFAVSAVVAAGFEHPDGSSDFHWLHSTLTHMGLPLPESVAARASILCKICEI